MNIILINWIIILISGTDTILIGNLLPLLYYCLPITAQINADQVKLIFIIIILVIANISITTFVCICKKQNLFAIAVNVLIGSLAAQLIIFAIRNSVSIYIIYKIFKPIIGFTYKINLLEVVFTIICITGALFVGKWIADIIQKCKTGYNRFT